MKAKIKNMKKDEIKQIIKKHYGKVAGGGVGCGSCSCDSDTNNEQVSKSIGYSEQEIKSVSDANLGLGCGNPTGMGEIKKGEVVLDLGSGAGFDCFLAAQKAGKSGKVIGIDITQEMIDTAKTNAKKYGYKNVEFRLGDIEKLPVDDNSIDVVISNCVINLAPDKPKVFSEVYRILKPGGRVYLSDIVLLKELSKGQRNNEKLIAGCVGGALLKDHYLKIIEDAGFKVEILSEDKDISKRQYKGAALESIKIEAQK